MASLFSCCEGGAAARGPLKSSPPDAAAPAPRGCAPRLGAALWRSAQSMYVWACFVYLVYCCQALAVDYCELSFPSTLVNTTVLGGAGTAEDPYTYEYYPYEAPSWQCAENGPSSINRQYVALASVHLVTAFMYGYAWRDWMALHASDTPLWARALIMVPEALNVVEAAIYVYTATLYGPYEADPECQLDPDCPAYHRLHRLELAGAAVEMAAALLWAWSWWYTFERVPGRGLTPFDPDFWSSLLLVIPSAMYIAYNVEVIAVPADYGSNFLYKKADVVYFVGSVLYLGAALRDQDAFFWLPCGCWAWLVPSGCCWRGCVPADDDGGGDGDVVATAHVTVGGDGEGAGGAAKTAQTKVIQGRGSVGRGAGRK